MRKPVNFKKSDVRRAISAANQEGLAVGCVEITQNGTIRLICAENQPNIRSDWADVHEKT